MPWQTELRNDGSQCIFSRLKKAPFTAGTYARTLALQGGTTLTKTVRLSTAGSMLSGRPTRPRLGRERDRRRPAGGDVALCAADSLSLLSSKEPARPEDAVAAVNSPAAPAERPSRKCLAAPRQTSLDIGPPGGYGGGILGWTTDAREITLVPGWNRYAGSDPVAVGPVQYDFQTVLTHEFGRALCLGHSAEAGSVMYTSLATEAARR